jgi:hypothetical protein
MGQVFLYVMLKKALKFPKHKLHRQMITICYYQRVLNFMKMG